MVTEQQRLSVQLIIVLLGLSVMLLPLLSWAQQSAVTVKVSPKAVILGEQVTLVIKGEKLQADFDKFNLAKLQRDFAIDDIDINSERIRLRMFPLRSGDLTIPAQKSGRIHVPERKIRVKDNPEVAVQWHRPDSKLYAQQQALWKAEVKVSNPAFLVNYQPPGARLSSEVEVHLQEASLEDALQAGERDSGVLSKFIDRRHTLVASYELPAVHKTQRLKLRSPMVVVKNTRHKLWKFFDRTVNAEIQPLPSFLPMSVSVGQVQAEIAALPFWQQSGDLLYWRWRLHGSGVTPAYLQTVANQLITQIGHQPEIGWLSESSQTAVSFNELGMISSLEVRLPYRTLTPGLVAFPELQLRYFDTQQGRVVSQSFAAQNTVVLPAWLVWLLQWLLVMGLLAAFLLGALLVKQAWLTRQLQRQLFRCEDSEQLWQAMQTWSGRQVSIGTLLPWLGRAQPRLSQQPLSQSSLGQWRDWYHRNFPENSELNQLIEQLNTYLYAEAANQVEWPIIQQSARAWSSNLPWLAIWRLA